MHLVKEFKADQGMELYKQLSAHIFEKNKQLLSNFQPDFEEKISNLSLSWKVSCL